MKWAHEEHERIIGQLFLGGGVCFALGVFLTFFGVFFGTAMLSTGVFLCFLGICLAGGALLIGFGHIRAGSAKGEPVQQECRIMARYAINEIGEMIFDNFDYDAEVAKYYVRIQFLGGKRDELECARPVFDLCGEGMRGLAMVQGSWLSQFVPLADTDQTRAAYRDW